MSDQFAGIVETLVGEARGKVQELHDLANAFKATRGSSDAVKTWIENSTDPEVVKKREAIAMAMEKIKEIRAELEEAARADIQPDDVDPAAIQEEFKDKRKFVNKLLLSSITSMGAIGADVSDLEEMQENLPNISGGVTASGRSPEEMERIREWARANGHEVADRGRIKKEILDGYAEAQKSGE